MKFITVYHNYKTILISFHLDIDDLRELLDEKFQNFMYQYVFPMINWLAIECFRLRSSPFIESRQSTTRSRTHLPDFKRAAERLLDALRS